MSVKKQSISLPSGFQVGGDQTFIIAEIGSNFNQSWDLAIESIDAAVESGANAVKFQSINIDKLYWKPNQETIELHKKIDLEESWHQKLKDHCDKRSITFFSSPTYLDAVDLLEAIDVPLYKLASAQIGTFPQIVRKVARTHKPVIFSTGLVNDAELDKVVDIFEQEQNPNYMILYCNSIYPTPYHKIHFNLLEQYREKYGKIVGFSDHSDGPYTAIAAVARGAKIIEKHFAMDRKLPVPDAEFSLEPDDFKTMVEGIRIVEQTLNINERDHIETEETQFKESIRTRLVLNKDVAKGKLVEESDFNYLRHSEGVDCRELSPIISGRMSYRISCSKGALLTKSDVS